MDEITESLERALDRIAEFQAIHHDGRPAAERREAVNCLQQAVGIEDETRVLIRERLYEAEGFPSAPSEMFLGVIVGLLAAQFEADRQPTEAASG